MIFSHDIFDFQLNSFVVGLFLSLFFDLAVNVAPAIEGFEFGVSVGVHGCLIESFTHIFLFDFILVEEGEWSGEVLIGFQLSVEFGDVNGHELDLCGFFLDLGGEADELFFGG